VEHLGRVVYGGIWVGEGSAVPNERGFRKDVLEALRAFHPPITRWPGGNFASAYHWLDGVGPREERPKKFEMAWNSVETNQFGTDEFMEWARAVGTEPYITVNAGNGSPEEAAAWVEYCNSERDTRYAELRRKYGHSQPYNVKVWSIGNELYGRWQVGYCVDGEECARRTLEFANEMRRVDPSIKLIGVGWDEDQDWNYKVVKTAGEQIDYLSVHRYLHPPSYPELAAASLGVEDMLNTTYGVVQSARRAGGIKRDVKVAFDEWNVWYEGPMERDATVGDAVFTGSMLIGLERLAGKVTMANFAQLVNVLPLIRTRDDGAFYVNPQYYAFLLFGPNSGEDVLPITSASPTYYSKELGRAVPYLDASATASGEAVYVHLVNRHEDEAARVTIKLSGFNAASGTHDYVSGQSPGDANSFDEPNKVAVQRGQEMELGAQTVELTVPPHSVNLVTLKRG